jgi:multidrug transporter EmrE-like cation transporter
MIDWIFISLTALSALLFTGGDVFLKYWTQKSSPTYMIIAFAFYLIAGVVLAMSFKRRELAVAIAVLTCFNLIAIAVIGLVLFKEVLGLKEIIGITLAILAIVVFNS